MRILSFRLQSVGCVILFIMTSMQKNGDHYGYVDGTFA